MITAVETPLTADEVLAILDDARTWPRCQTCNGLHPGTTHDTTAWVDTDLRTIHTPQDLPRIAAVLGHAHLHTLADGRFRIACRSRAQAISVARCLRVLGTPAGAITIGGGSE